MKNLPNIIEKFEACILSCDENLNSGIDEVIKELIKVKNAPASCWKVETIYQGLSYINHTLVNTTRELEVRLRQLQILKQLEATRK